MARRFATYWFSTVNRVLESSMIVNLHTLPQPRFTQSQGQIVYFVEYFLLVFFAFCFDKAFSRCRSSRELSTTVRRGRIFLISAYVMNMLVIMPQDLWERHKVP